MPRRLDELEKGAAATVAGIDSVDAVLAQRILALGVLPGQRVRVVSIAPLGDPISIEGPNGRIALRRREAAAVEIEAEAGAAAP